MQSHNSYRPKEVGIYKKNLEKVQMKVWKHGFEKEKGVYFEPMVLFAFCNNK